MNTLVVVAALAAFCLVAGSAEPEAEPGYGGYRGHGSYTRHGSYVPYTGGYHGGSNKHYIGKRSAEALADPEPGYKHAGHGHYLEFGRSGSYTGGYRGRYRGAYH
ncbi:uncharacterized protein LOC121874275 [Homarus americanus]|uniref:uncharacterized protein LOC121874275 n=1 Tax=Homarus americanus TaxID=6706 RepID=UPI001C43C33A|nr:uncharacterized protein LOC121874275 [Homarus americanus]